MVFWENQKLVSALYAQCSKPVCAKYGLTRMEYDILMFLHNNPQYDTAAEIVRVRMLTKSHVSSAVKTLEEKGFLTGRFKDGGHKAVRLTITEKADPLIRDGEAAQLAFGEALFRGFSPEERRLCRDLFNRMCGNARNGI